MTLEEMCQAALHRDPAQQAYEFAGRWYSWGEMRAVADAVADLLARTGADPRAPVALMPRTRPAAAAALLGLIAAGRNIRMVYVFQSAAGLVRDILVRDPAVVVGGREDFTDEVVAALKARGIAGIALDDVSAGAVPGLERAGAAGDLSASPRQIEILTSGTTGAPKPFALPFDLLVAGLPMTAGGVAPFPHYFPAPIGNISGIIGILPNAVRGNRLVMVDRFTVESWHDYILRHRPSFSALPAAGVQMVLDAGIPVEDLAGVQTITVGAAPLHPRVHRAFEARYGIPILLAFGATEFLGSLSAMTPQLHAEWGERKFGSVGRAVAGRELRVVDPETGAVLPPGETGVLEVLAPAIGPDWVRTTDMVLIDADGFVFHRGRADGAINRGGFKIMPETIERALLLHPAISEAVVVPVPDRRLGQVPGAAIKLRPGQAEPPRAELEAHMRDHVLKTHLPAHWMVLADMPRNPSNKLDRRAVRALFEAAHPA